MNDPRMRVIFIIGASRSGSTLLALLLGRFPGVFSAGELNFLWQRGVMEGQLCGCGQPTQACDFWQPVLAHMAGPASIQDYGQRVLSLVEGTEPLKHVPTLFWQLLTGTPSPLLADYLDQQRALLAAMRQQDGRPWVVDSSKFPTRALAFACDPGLKAETVVIHLVRDPRGVAFSRMSKKRRPEVTDREAYMDRRGYFYSALAWVHMNLLSWCIGLPYRKADRYRMLRYETLCRDPARVLAELGAWLDLGTMEPEDPQAPLPHTISGNPIRFKPITDIQADERFRQGMSRWQRVVVTAVTWPVNLFLGKG